MSAAVDLVSTTPLPEDLDRATFPAEPWGASYYPAAGEGVISPVRPRPRTRTFSTGSEPSGRSERVAAARARRRVARYAVANRLTLLATLTVAGEPPTPNEVSALVAAFIVDLRRARGGPFPYVSVVEVGESGRPHAHVLLPAVSRATLARAWGHGRVDLQWLRSTVSRRRAALYMSKGFDTPRAGRHRYEVGKGFAPEVLRIGASSLAAAQRALIEFAGREPDDVRLITFADEHVTVMQMTWDDL